MPEQPKSGFLLAILNELWYVLFSNERTFSTPRTEGRFLEVPPFWEEQFSVNVNPALSFERQVRVTKFVA